MKYVTIRRFAHISGYSEKAIRNKIDTGIWLQNHQWRRGPDNRILIDIEGVEKWVESASRPGSKSTMETSAYHSSTAAGGVVRL